MPFLDFVRSKLPGWLMDVRVWILVFFLLRLENINLPPLDEHQLRQTLTLMVSRNLIEISPNPLIPMLSFGQGTKPEPVGLEPGIYNSLIAGSYLIFGEHYWNSRLINLIVSSIGLWYFFSFLRKFWDRNAALSATVFFAVSVAFIYSRKTMPDTFALSFVFVANYFGACFLENGRRKDLIAFTAAMSVGLLAKLPAVCVATLLLLPLLQYRPDWSRIRTFFLAGLIPVGLMSIWYFWWVPTLIKNGGMQLYETYGFKEGWRQLWERREGLWQTFSRTQMKSYAAFAMLLPGVFALGWQRQKAAVLAILASAAVFTVFVIQAAYAYPTHEYYGMPLNPAYAMVAGFGLAHLLGRWPRALWLALALVAFDAIRNQKEDFFIPWHQQKFLQLEKLADQVSSRDDKFLVNDAVFTRMMYFLHRKGRSENNELFKKYPEWVEDYGREGVKFICIDRSTYPDSLAYPVVVETPEFRIYRHTWKDH